MTASTYDRDVSEGRRHAIAGGWAGTDADLYAIGWAAARKAPIAPGAVTEAMVDAAAHSLSGSQPVDDVCREFAREALAAALTVCVQTAADYCHRCGHGCGHLEACVFVLDTEDGPVCLDTQACTARREADAALSINTTGAALIATWDALWCRSCGNRYSPGVSEDECSCGTLVPLQPVTVQLVSRKAKPPTPDRST